MNFGCMFPRFVLSRQTVQFTGLTVCRCNLEWLLLSVTHQTLPAVPNATWWQRLEKGNLFQEMFLLFILMLHVFLFWASIFRHVTHSLSLSVSLSLSLQSVMDLTFEFWGVFFLDKKLQLISMRHGHNLESRMRPCWLLLCCVSVF